MTTTHRLYWDTDGTPVVKCEGGDRESDCHNFPDCECEYWEGHGLHVHPYARHDLACWIVNYLTPAVEESYWPADNSDAECPHRDGLIIVSFEGDYATWHYADELVTTRG